MAWALEHPILTFIVALSVLHGVLYTARVVVRGWPQHEDE